MAAAAIIAAKKVRAEALAREGAMTDDDIRELIERRKKQAELDAVVHRTAAQDADNYKNGCCRNYIKKVANPAQKLTEDDRFNNFIIGIIIKILFFKEVMRRDLDNTIQNHLYFRVI